MKFKVAMLTHNTLYSTQPAYLLFLLNYHTPAYAIRSANTNLLSVPRVRTTFASRGFSVAAPVVWNLLPSGIRDCSFTHTFCRLLKIHCFQHAVSSPSSWTNCLRVCHCPTLCTPNIRLCTLLTLLFDNYKQLAVLVVVVCHGTSWNSVRTKLTQW